MKANPSPSTKSTDQDQYLKHSTPQLPLKSTPSTPATPPSAFEHAAFQIPMLAEKAVPSQVMGPPPSYPAINTLDNPYDDECHGLGCHLWIPMLSLISLATTLLIATIAVLAIRRCRKRRAARDVYYVGGDGTRDRAIDRRFDSAVGGLDGAGDEDVQLRVMDPVRVGQESCGMGVDM